MSDDALLKLIYARQEMQRAALRVSLALVGGGSTSDLHWRELAEAGRKLADAQDAADAWVAEKQAGWVVGYDLRLPQGGTA